MALIKCPECGAQISDQAAFCPHCGRPALHQKQPKRKSKLVVVVLCIVVILVAAVVGLCIYKLLHAPKSATYPLNMDEVYAAAALDPPSILWDTTAEENGLEGLIYEFDGKIINVNTYKDESGIYEYEDAMIQTDQGLIIFTNMYRTIYNAEKDLFGRKANQFLCTEPVGNYVFPGIGENAHFVGVYMGYSGEDHCPVFVLGASPAIYQIMDLPDFVGELIESENK